VTGAVFLDRDGTLIELVHHLTDPADVRLISGVGEALRRLRAAGWATVVVTNQSVIGRGKLTEAGLAEVHDERILALTDEEAPLSDAREVDVVDELTGVGVVVRQRLLADVVDRLLEGHRAVRRVPRGDRRRPPLRTRGLPFCDQCLFIPAATGRAGCRCLTEWRMP